MDTFTASRQVFVVPELLEAILLNLTTKDLLLAQRVSRSFRNTTQGSIRLRRKLFLEPDWRLAGRMFNAYAKDNRPGPKPENNRLLLRAFHGYYPTVTLVIDNDGSTDQTIFSSPISSNPSNVNRDEDGDDSAPRRGSEEWKWDVCISFPADRVPTCSPAVAYPEASWRKMYLSQPPCTSLYLVRRWQRSLRPAMIRDGGITMGDFFDETTKPLPGCQDRKWHESYISSDRDWHFEGNIKCSSVEE